VTKVAITPTGRNRIQARIKNVFCPCVNMELDAIIPIRATARPTINATPIINVLHKFLEKS
jgi:hypothetical protein